jgi:hypothetical protein
MIIPIQGREIGYVPPIIFGFLTEIAGSISAVEGLMAGAGVPLSVAELDDIHFTIL